MSKRRGEQSRPAGPIREAVAEDAGQLRRRILGAVVGVFIVSFALSFLVLWGIEELEWERMMNSSYDPDGPGPTRPSLAWIAFPIAALAAAWMALVTQYWTTHQLIRAVWLRRFHSEDNDRFRVSSVIEGLSRRGIGVITLQDSKVRTSPAEWRRRCLVWPWRIALPVALIPALLVIVFGVLAEWLKGTADGITGAGVFQLLIGAVMVGGGVYVASVVAIAFVLTPAIMAFASMKFVPWRWRNDFPKLADTIKNRLLSGRGTVIVRIPDANWQEAVGMCLKAVDAAIIDVSEISDPILWEVRSALGASGDKRLVLIESAGAHAKRTSSAWQSLENAFGRPIAASEIIQYPEKLEDVAGGKKFDEALRNAIYEAYGR